MFNVSPFLQISNLLSKGRTFITQLDLFLLLCNSAYGQQITMSGTEEQIGYVTSFQHAQAKVYLESAVQTWDAKLPWIPLFNPKKPHLVTSPLIPMGYSPNTPTSWKIQVSDDCWDCHRRVRTIGLFLWRLNLKQLAWHNETDQYKIQQNAWFNMNPMTLYKFEILDNEGNPQFTRESNIRFLNDGVAIGGKNFALYEDVLRKNCIKEGRTMTIRTTITLFRLLETDRGQNVIIIFQNKRLGEYRASNLARNSNLGRFLTNFKGELCSIIHFEQIIPKELLALSPSILTMMIRNMCIFLDRGKCKLLERKSTLKIKTILYEFAKYFCIKDLKRECIKSMIKFNLTVHECLKIVRFMSKLGIINAVEYAAQINQLKSFFRKNIEDISQTEDFNNAYYLDYGIFTRLVLAPDLKPITAII